MLYAIRNEEGRIVSLSESYKSGAEAVDIKDQEVLSFLSISDAEFGTEAFLEKSDTEVARIFEDLVDVLIQKGVIMFTDLPDKAQQKLLSRKLARNINRDDQPDDPDSTQSSSFFIDDGETL